jgi:hypothetical protein
VLRFIKRRRSRLSSASNRLSFGCNQDTLRNFAYDIKFGVFFLYDSLRFSLVIYDDKLHTQKTETGEQTNLLFRG